MYHYNFTNDLRISNLENTLRDAANAFLTDSVPSANEDKSRNNNYMTVGFYFNLKSKGVCARLAANGCIKKVVLNFIRKFQFPNMRTRFDYESSISDGIKLAPMRVIVKLLNALFLIDKKEAFLTKDEIKHFIFFNSNVAKIENPNIIETALQLLSYRNNKSLPLSISTKETEHFWNQPDRQIREMIKTLRWTGCFSDDDDKIKFDANNISRDLKADLFEIIYYNSFWKGHTVDDWQKYMDDGLDAETAIDENKFLPENQSPLILTLPSFPPSQIIYYGVPGCGKSNKIREQLKNVPEKNKVRVVFHPEYTNAEFIGQILPVTNDGIRYEFTPGPFTQIIKRAYLNPNEHFYLVIEEINRGNAAAIFGDTFQLLDRLKAGETDSLGNDPANAAVNTFTEGWSQYFVQNDDINAYVRKATKQDDGSYQERNDGESIEEIKIKEIHFNANTAIRLPPNLSILATMNTSDQNVFTLDNAFQRRFDMELVRNEFDLDKPSVNVQYNAKIADTNIKWGQFWEWINAKITATLKGLSSTEDKRLGVWFVSNVGGVINEKVFAEKVLKYLWDDVFKFKRSKVFVEEIDTLEKLIAAFEKPEQGKSRFAVFKNFPEFSSSGAERSQNEGAANP